MKIDKFGFNWGDILFGVLGSSGFVLFLYFFTSYKLCKHIKTPIEIFLFVRCFLFDKVIQCNSLR